MQNIVNLLAEIAQNATLQNREALANHLDSQELSAELKAAILAGDSQAIARMLDVTPDIVCIILPADDEEEETEQEDSESGSEQSVVNI